MRSRLTDRLQAVSPRYSLVIAVFAGLALFLIWQVEVTVIVHSPALGEVSQELEYLSGGIATLVGVAASLTTIYNTFGQPQGGESADRTNRVSEGPADSITVEGNLFQINADDVTLESDGDIETMNERGQDRPVQSDEESETESATQD